MSVQKVVVITGASSGIGAGCAHVFHTAGYFVIGLDVQPPINQSIQKSIDQFHEIDLSNPESISSLAKLVQAKHPRINALVNNAGINTPIKPTVEWSLEDYDRLMAINLRAPFLLCQKFHPMLKAAQGAIVNVSSVHAKATDAQVCAYAASKGGLCAMTRALAIDFGPDKIRVNSILPGAVDTPLHRGHLEGSFSPGGFTKVDEKMAEFSQKSIVGRVGQVEELGKAALFLADNEKSSFITGAEMVVDGGLLTKLTTV